METVVGVVAPNVATSIRQWQELPDWAKTTIKLVGQEAAGVEEMAVDGNPLGALKTNVSRPTKHFYWDLGELQSNFPITTDTQVVFTSDAAPDARGPAKARINWVLPTRTIYDVEVDLWDWTTSEEADVATVEEWQQKLLTDEELQKEIATDVALEVVSIIPVGRVAGAGGKVIFRVILKNKVAARVVAGVTEKAFLRATTREVIKDGVKVAPRPLWKSNKIRTRVKDAVRRAEAKAQDIATDQVKDGLSDDNEPPADNGADDEPPGDRDHKREAYIGNSPA